MWFIYMSSNVFLWIKFLRFHFKQESCSFVKPDAVSLQFGQSWGITVNVLDIFSGLVKEPDLKSSIYDTLHEDAKAYWVSDWIGSACFITGESAPHNNDKDGKEWVGN